MPKLKGSQPNSQIDRGIPYALLASIASETFVHALHPQPAPFFHHLSMDSSPEQANSLW
jgi:hypothetical protein